MSASAVLSADEVYRYTLVREFPPLDPGRDLGRVCWQLCNPSTADASVDDPTVRKGVGFALRWGYSSIEFVNRGAFRATNPKALLTAADPIGPDNARHVTEAFDRADLIVFAWGKAWPTRLDRLSPVPTADAVCLGRNGDGSPRHPLMLAYTTPLERWGGTTEGDTGATMGQTMSSEKPEPPYPVALYPGCPCLHCDRKTWPTDAFGTFRLSLCPSCGSKRCPGAVDHAMHRSETR